jgi:hypothetical protein
MEWLSMLSSTAPSEWARSLVRGVYDLHVHVAPDVMRRRVTDVQLARRCWDAGLAGFVLKSHYVPTAERAAVVNEALGGEVQALGALTLNASVGGMDPLAVEIAAREGARILCPGPAGGVPGTLFLPAVHGHVRLGPHGRQHRGHRARVGDSDHRPGVAGNPPVEDGLSLMADALRAAGFTDEEITTMIVDNSRLLAGADAPRAEPRRR